MSAAPLTPQRFTDEELISCLQFAARDIGGILTAGTFTEYGRPRTMPDGRAWPTDQAMVLRFGSWRAALAAADLPANPSTPIAGQSLFTDDDMLDAVRTLGRQLGKTPSVAEYDRWARSLHGGVPSASTVRKRFGRWTEMIQRLNSDER